MGIQSLLINGIVLVLGGMIGYHAIYLPQQEEVASIKQQMEQERLTQRAQQDVNALLKQFDQYRGRLAPEPQTSWLVQEVVRLGQQAGLQLTTINQESPQAVKAFTRLSATLQFTTTYHQLGAFLDALERSGHFIRTERVTIGQAQPDGKAAMQVTLSSLYVPPPVKGL